MSATVGAVLKKIAVAVFTNPKALKKVLMILLIIFIVLFMPVFTVLATFSSDMSFDTSSIQQQIVANMSAEQKSQLQAAENTMNSIDTEMTDAGLESRVRDAQVLYVLALTDYSEQDDFVETLVSCFKKKQTDEKLISAVNYKFGTSIKVEDFENVMNGIKAVYIDISEYKDISTKNNIDLVKWVKRAEKAGWGYVWGSHGKVLTDDEYENLKTVFGSHVTDYEEFILQNWMGRRTADCVGLIKGYGWYNTETKKFEVGANGMEDVTADGMFSAATEKGTIDTIPETLGIAVWHKGHIGVYIGDGKVIEAKGSKYGVVKTNLEDGAWTHWLKIPDIKYIET